VNIEADVIARYIERLAGTGRGRADDLERTLADAGFAEG